MQLFAKTGYESRETKGFGWIDAEVRKINNMNKKLKLPHMGWNEIELKKDCFLFSNIKNKSHVYFIHSYEFMTKEKRLCDSYDKLWKFNNSICKKRKYCWNSISSRKKSKKWFNNFRKFFEMENIMIIFPAIDIKDGKCVRLIKGDFNQITSYKKTPFDQAKIYFKTDLKIFILLI